MRIAKPNVNHFHRTWQSLFGFVDFAIRLISSKNSRQLNLSFNWNMLME